MNKKAIATQAIVLIVVLFFVIIITTGTLSWLAITDIEKKSLEVTAKNINQGDLLRNFLRKPIEGTEMNLAEFIIKFSNEEVDANTLDIKQLFLKIQILDNEGNIISTIKGIQEKSSGEIELEQIIPNYIGESPPYYIIKMQQTKSE